MRGKTVFGGMLLVALLVPFLSAAAEDGKADIFCRAALRVEDGQLVGSNVTVSGQDGAVIRRFRTKAIRVLRRSGDGRFLATMHDGSVQEFDLFGKRLWSLPKSPVDAEEGQILHADPLPEDRILLTVTMRQRVGGGCRAVAIDREGHVLKELNLGPDCRWVRPAGEGCLIVCPRSGPPYETGWDGKDHHAIGAFSNLDGRCVYFNALILPDGHVVVGHGSASMQEVDQDGNVVWSVERAEAVQLYLLGNGHLLVAST